VDFNQLEHALDDAPNVGAWQLELRKAGDDPLDLDDIILHVQKTGSVPDRQFSRELHERFYQQTEVHPNQIVFHNAAAMRRLQGVGEVIKEQRIVDHRPRANGNSAIAQTKPEPVESA
jgi:hypothetical protein